MHDNKNKYTFRKHKAYGLVGAMFATALMATPGALSQVPILGSLIGDYSVVKANDDIALPPWTGDPTLYDYLGREIVYRENPTYTYQENTNMEAGKKNTLTEGIEGGKVSYKWRVKATGEVRNTEQWFTGRPGTIEVGTQPKVTTEEIQPTEKRYVADKTRERGAEDIEEKGQVGRKEVTTTYTLNTSNGAVTPNEPTSRVISNPTPTVVKVAAKDKVETIQRGRQTVEKTTQNKQNSTSNRLFILSKISTPTTFYTIIKLNKYHKNISNQKKRGKLVYFPLSCTNLFKSLF